MSEEAISVIDSAADIYWENIKALPKVAERVSIVDVMNIFDKAVIPAINEVRRLDRESRNN